MLQLRKAVDRVVELRTEHGVATKELDVFRQQQVDDPLELDGESSELLGGSWPHARTNLRDPARVVTKFLRIHSVNRFPEWFRATRDTNSARSRRRPHDRAVSKRESTPEQGKAFFKRPTNNRGNVVLRTASRARCEARYDRLERRFASNADIERRPLPHGTSDGEVDATARVYTRHWCDDLPRFRTCELQQEAHA